MQDNKILQIVYTFFVGILIALFIGVGVNTFYPGPEYPECHSIAISYDKEPTEEQRKAEQDCQKQSEAYFEEEKSYSRDVSIIALVAAAVLLVVSLLYEKKIKVIADGVLLGGVFTLLYSIGRGFASEDTRYNFIVISIALVIALYLGYRRFVKDVDIKASDKSKKSNKK